MLKILLWPLEEVENEKEVCERLQNDSRLKLFVKPGDENDISKLSWLYWGKDTEQLQNDYPEIEEGEFNLDYNDFISDYFIQEEMDGSLYSKFGITEEEIAETILEGYYGSIDYFEELWNSNNTWNKLDKARRWAIGWCIGQYLANHISRAVKIAKEMNIEIEFDPAVSEMNTDYYEATCKYVGDYK